MEKNVTFEQVVIFSDDSGDVLVDAVSLHGTFWLTKLQICELYDKDVKYITRHINHIFIECELDRESNIQRWFMKGLYQRVQFFSLDVIIAVGYKVKSLRGQQFRKWVASLVKKQIQ